MEKLIQTAIHTLLRYRPYEVSLPPQCVNLHVMDSVYGFLDETPEAAKAAIDELAVELSMIIISTVDEIIELYFGQDSIVVFDKVFDDSVMISGYGNEVTTRHIGRNTPPS